MPQTLQESRADCRHLSGTEVPFSLCQVDSDSGELGTIETLPPVPDWLPVSLVPQQTWIDQTQRKQPEMLWFVLPHGELSLCGDLELLA